MPSSAHPTATSQPFSAESFFKKLYYQNTDSEMPGLSLTVPRLEDYDISPRTGFLPEERPLQRLPDPYFAPWESAVLDINGLLLAGRLRERIDKLPLLNVDRLTTNAERRRAFLVLAMLSHAYVWGKHEIVSDKLPRCLAVPWTLLASELGMCPVTCHAALVLWNWRELFPDNRIELDNLSTLHTYSGSLDESWFYLVTTAIEAAGAPSLAAIIGAIRAIQARDTPQLLVELRTIHSCIIDMNTQLVRMFEKCDPYVFYWKIRPYLAGWENMAEAGLPLGLIYEGVDDMFEADPDYYADMSHLTEEQRHLIKYRKYAGGSAAQSSLIQALDIAFGVEHRPTGEKRATCSAHMSVDQLDRYNNMPPHTPAAEIDDAIKPGLKKNVLTGPPPPPPNRNNFIMTMRQYMPGPHRAFLEHLTKIANIRPFMLDIAEHIETGAYDREELSVASQALETFNACLHQIKLFRDKHVQIVSLYIIQQARKGPSIAHGGFAIAHGEEAAKQNAAPPTPPPSVTASPLTTPPATPTSGGCPFGHKAPSTDRPLLRDATRSNILYPQTVLETSPPVPRGAASVDPVPVPQSPSRVTTLGLAKTLDKNAVVRGTGGTNVIPFLKQARDETVEAKIEIDLPEVESRSIEDIKAENKNAQTAGWGKMFGLAR